VSIERAVLVPGAFGVRRAQVLDRRITGSARSLQHRRPGWGSGAGETLTRLSFPRSARSGHPPFPAAGKGTNLLVAFQPSCLSARGAECGRAILAGTSSSPFWQRRPGDGRGWGTLTRLSFPRSARSGHPPFPAAGKGTNLLVAFQAPCLSAGGAECGGAILVGTGSHGSHPSRCGVAGKDNRVRVVRCARNWSGHHSGAANSSFRRLATAGFWWASAAARS
jgi:hypothetical protein